MRILAVLLSWSLITPAYSQQAQQGLTPEASSTEQPAVTVPVLPPLTVTAPRPQDKQTRDLKRTRTAGGAVGLGGAGLSVGATIVGLGALATVWGAGLVFAGGLIAYLSHRRLQGKNDFGPPADEAAGSLTAPTAKAAAPAAAGG